MKALWFIPMPIPVLRSHLHLGDGGRGWWIDSLLNKITENKQVEIATAWISRSVESQGCFEHNGAKHYYGPLSRKGYYSQQFNKELDWCKKVIDSYKPDIIHIHGTESFYGLLGKMTDTPSVLSVQGLLFVCLQAYRTYVPIRKLSTYLQLIRVYLDMKIRSKTEKEVIKSMNNFIGRTLWDKSNIHSINTFANYHYASELLRPIFYNSEWAFEKASPGTIYCTSSGAPYKGVNCLIDALDILRRKKPDIQLRVGGISHKSGYGACLWDMVKEKRLTGNVTFLGSVTETEVVNEICSANVYVMPSYIENSSNSLCEAMVLGAPCVASFAGGTPSLLTDEYSGLMFPAGDGAYLAEQIWRIISDRRLSERLSMNARQTGLLRHDPNKVMNSYLEIYKHIAFNEE